MTIHAGALLSRPVFNRNGIFFWLFGVVVKLRYPFFLMTLLLGAGRRDIVGLLIWLVVVTLAILLHELGHAFAAQSLGCSASIELNTFGGLTYWTGRDPTWRRRLLVSLAGPGIGFAAAGLYWMVASLSEVSITSYHVRLFVNDFLWVTIGWGAFNLLPILPLDGGATLEAILESRLGAERSRYVTRVVSCFAGGLGALVALGTGLTWAGILCAVFAYNNWMMLRGLRGVQLFG